MITIFESDHNWTGNPSPESAHFSYTFHPENAFMSFYDYSIDIMSSFELIQNSTRESASSCILKGPGLATILTSDARDIIVDFHFNDTLPEISDPAWLRVAEGVISCNSGKMHVDGGTEVEVGILLDPGSYAFRVYFAKHFFYQEPYKNKDYQQLAIYFQKSETEESGEIKVLKAYKW